MPQSSDLQLYFIAVVPPEPIARKIYAVKELIFNKFGAKYALKKPPHITLQPPAKLTNLQAEELVNGLQSFAAAHHSVKVHCKGYGHFSDRVVYIDVVEQQVLKELHLNLAHYLRARGLYPKENIREEPFHAHLTIANRDVKGGRFQKIWQHFKDENFEAEFTANHLMLYRHDGKLWQEWEKVLLVI